MQKLNLESDKKREVEDYTGCIPLLLDKCIENGKINLETDFWTAYTFKPDRLRRTSKHDIMIT